MIDKTKDTVNMVEEDTEKVKKSSSKDKYIPAFTAQKDHTIKFNDELLEIKKDEEYSEIAAKWKETLKTEGVL